jgi:hypothetical protein
MNAIELKDKENEEKQGIPLSIGILGNEEGLWKDKQKERKLISKELF